MLLPSTLDRRCFFSVLSFLTLLSFFWALPALPFLTLLFPFLVLIGRLTKSSLSFAFLLTPTFSMYSSRSSMSKSSSKHCCSIFLSSLFSPIVKNQSAFCLSHNSDISFTVNSAHPHVRTLRQMSFSQLSLDRRLPFEARLEQDERY